MPWADHNTIWALRQVTIDPELRRTGRRHRCDDGIPGEGFQGSPAELFHQRVDAGATEPRRWAGARSGIDDVAQ